MQNYCNLIFTSFLTNNKQNPPLVQQPPADKDPVLQRK